MYSAGFCGKILAMDVSQVIETVDCLVMDGRELSQLAADFTWYLRNLLLCEMFGQYGRCAGCIQ